MRVDVTIPKKWGELNSAQLIGLSSLFLKYREKHDFLARCFLLLAGWKILRWRYSSDADGRRFYCFKRPGQKRFYLAADLFATVVKNVEWVTTTIALPGEMPQLKGFHPCDTELYGVSIEEYLKADNYFRAYYSTRKVEYLDTLVAVFYLRKREQYDGNRVDRRARRFRTKPMAFKYAVFLWFLAIPIMLKNKYPFVFSGGEIDSQDPRETVMALLSSLNKGDVTANKEIFRTHVHECFYELDQRIQHSKTK
jgi:hypothetical protein